MNRIIRLALLIVAGWVVLTMAGEAQNTPRAYIDGTGPGWRALREADFTNVNGDPGTWTWKSDVLYCTGQPIGVMRTQKQYTEFRAGCTMAAS